MSTKKDFEMTARILRERHKIIDQGNPLATNAEHAVVDCIAQDFAFEFARQNPRFDRDRFLSACESTSR